MVRHFLDEYDQYQQYRGVPCPGFQSQVSEKCDVCVGVSGGGEYDQYIPAVQGRALPRLPVTGE